MNPLPLSVPWMPIAFLAVEAGIVALLLLFSLRSVSNAKWQKIFCQAAVLTILLLIGCEFIGIGNLLVARLSSSLVIRTNQRINNAASSETREFVPQSSSVPSVAEQAEVIPSEIQPVITPAGGREAGAIQTARTKLRPRVSAMIFQGFCLTWVVGVLVLMLRSGFGRLTPKLPRWRRTEMKNGELPERVRNLARKLGLNRRIRLLESSRLAGPIAFGIFKPTIALPAQFASMHESAKQDAILIHELAHLAGNDPAWHLLSEAATILLWWHPVVWWLRRQLQVTSELAADEASLLVEDGPGALAESLLHLGSELVGRRWAGELSIAAFRSNLGCRVQRLLELEEKRISQPNLAGAVLVRTLGAMMAAGVLILCMACLTPKETLKGNSTMKAPWRNSLFTVTLMTALQSIVTTHVKAQTSPNGAATAATQTVPLSQLSEDDKLRIRYGLPPNGASSGQPAKQVAATQHDPATDREMRRRYGLAPSATPASSATETSTGAIREIEGKLKHITLDKVSFENLPLSEVIRYLSDEAARHDPVQQGINFLIHNNPVESLAQPPMIDPSTGLPLAATAEPVDVPSVLINFTLPLKHIALKDVLDAIVKVADHPIQYSVEDYAVVFAPRAGTASDDRPATSKIPVLGDLPVVGRLFQSQSTESVPNALSVRTFKVNTNNFAAGLQSAFGISVTYEKIDGAQKPNMKLALRKLLDELGIPAGAGRSIFYNEMTGMVMVRASEAEMRTMEAAMDTLTGESAGLLDPAKTGN
jgi:beta-lactamase regulating signal transducer with metallopeptidase domain